MVEPVNGYLAILYCTLILIGLGIIFHIAKWSAKRKYFTKLEKVYKLLKRQIGYEVSNVCIYTFVIWYVFFDSSRGQSERALLFTTTKKFLLYLNLDWNGRYVFKEE